MGFRSSSSISVISICDAKCSDQTGRIILVDSADRKQYLFQSCDWELKEKGLRWPKTSVLRSVGGEGGWQHMLFLPW